MKRLSSKWTVFYKKIFPIIWFGILIFIGLGAFGAGKKIDEPGILIGALLFMAAFGYLLMKHLVFDLADEVWGRGDNLLIKNKGIDVIVHLSNIINVNYAHYMNPPKVTLDLRTPCRLGKSISYSAHTSIIPFKKDPLVMELIEKIDTARRG